MELLELELPAKRTKKAKIKPTEDEPVIVSLRTYDEMLTKIYAEMTAAGIKPSSENSQLELTPPALGKYGTKRTLWTNFNQTISELGSVVKLVNFGSVKLEQHFSGYIAKELHMTTSTNEMGGLVIGGRIQPKHIEKVIRKYVSEYIRCKSCKSTRGMILSKGSAKYRGLCFLSCGSCQSKRTVD